MCFWEWVFFCKFLQTFRLIGDSRFSLGVRVRVKGVCVYVPYEPIQNVDEWMYFCGQWSYGVLQFRLVKYLDKHQGRLSNIKFKNVKKKVIIKLIFSEALILVWYMVYSWLILVQLLTFLSISFRHIWVTALYWFESGYYTTVNPAPWKKTAAAESFFLFLRFYSY